MFRMFFKMIAHKRAAASSSDDDFFSNADVLAQLERAEEAALTDDGSDDGSQPVRSSVRGSSAKRRKVVCSSSDDEDNDNREEPVKARARELFPASSATGSSRTVQGPRRRLIRPPETSDSDLTGDEGSDHDVSEDGSPARVKRKRRVTPRSGRAEKSPKKEGLKLSDFSLRVVNSAALHECYGDKGAVIATQLQALVDDYNEHLPESDDPVVFKLDFSDKDGSGGYRVYGYSRVNKHPSKLSRFYNQFISRESDHVAESQDVHLLFFYVREDAGRRDIFALSSGQAFHVTDPVVQYGVPYKLIRRLTNVADITEAKATLTVPDFDDVVIGGAPDAQQKLTHIFSMITPRVRKLSSLLRIVGGNRFKMQASAGTLRMSKQIAVDDLPDVLTLFSTIMRGGKTRRPKADGKGSESEHSDPGYDFMDYVVSAPADKRDALDERMLDALYRQFKQEPSMPLFLDKRFLECNSFYLRKGDRDSVAQERVSDLEELIEPLMFFSTGNGLGSLDRFKEDIRATSVVYTSRGGHTPVEVPILKLLQGEVHDEGRVYFKINQQWRTVSGRHFLLMESEFIRLITHHLQNGQPMDPGLREWPVEDGALIDEKTYNRLYLDDANMFVGDCVCHGGVEFFDLLHVSDDAVTLIHVKKGLDQSAAKGKAQLEASRDYLRHRGPSQYADFVLSHDRAALEDDSTLAHLYDKISGMGKEAFCKLFEGRPVRFVYAFVDTAETERWLPGKSLKSQLEESDLEAIFDGLSQDELLPKLVEQDYLTDDNRIMPKLMYHPPGKMAATLGVSLEVAQALHGRLSCYSTGFRSSMAKQALMGLENSISDYGLVQVKQAAD